MQLTLNNTISVISKLNYRTSFLHRYLLSSSQLWDVVCVKCSPLLSPWLTQAMCSAWNLAWYPRQEVTIGLELILMRFSSGGFLLWTVQKHIDYYPLPKQNNPVYFFPGFIFLFSRRNKRETIGLHCGWKSVEFVFNFLDFSITWKHRKGRTK